MKLKYFLRGLGSGIIFTVILVTLVGGKSHQATMTDQEIIAKAKQLGLVESIDNKLDDLDASPSAEPSKEPTATPTEAPTTAPTEAPTEAPTKAPTTAPKKEKAVSSEKQVSLKIVKGMTSDMVAQKLHKLGVVGNAAKFDQYLCDHGYQSKLQTGNYRISSEDSYYQIAMKITNKSK